MNILVSDNVCLTYGRGETSCEVLKNFSLAVERGEFVALMGPSGSGKSTFLHLAAGLLTPSGGTITVGDTCVTSLGDSAAAMFRRRHEGVVFQAFNLIDTLSVRENIMLPAKLDHARCDENRLIDLLAKLGLADKSNRHPSELSGGEQQRVAIARALFRRPDIILADEPTGNLDAKASHVICEILRTLNETEESAILLVTHDPVVAAAASRVCFLKNGQIAASFATNHDPAAISKRYLEYFK